MSTIFDHAGSLHRMGNDEELFREMAILLCSDAPLLLGEVAAACNAGDLTTAQRAAHTLKGLASNFGAERAVAAAAEMERLARFRESAGMATALVELTEALDELVGVLTPYCQATESCS